jgi:hypothetical protein
MNFIPTLNLSEKSNSFGDSVDIDINFSNSIIADRISNLLKMNKNENNEIDSMDDTELTVGILSRWLITRMILLDHIGIYIYIYIYLYI